MTRQRIACFGGIYSNYLALTAAIHDARSRGVDSMYCLGDFGGFGPHPNRSLEILRQEGVVCLQGNYDHSIGHALDDCQCGYTDSRDNYFAQISYDYTQRMTDPEHCRWMRDLPSSIRFEWGSQKVFLSHGSPRKRNEFLWESTTSTHFLERLAERYDADLMLGTHTGIHWLRPLMSGKQWVNVGVLGRPENDGTTQVGYVLLEMKNSDIRPEYIRVHYDHDRLAKEMQAERLPEEFIETIQTGWWSTCLEILPGKERRRGKY